MPDFDYIAKMQQLKETDQKRWTWTWECAEVLHKSYDYDVKAAFSAALEALDGNERCDACDRYCVFPRDHAFDCPLATNDEPSYVAYCIQGNDEADDSDPSEATSPAGWRHP